MSEPLDLKTFQFISIVQTAILAKEAFPLKEEQIDRKVYNGNTAAMGAVRELEWAYSVVQLIPSSLDGIDAALEFVGYTYEGGNKPSWIP